MYLNLIQIAESFGVSERAVEEWIRAEGLPHVIDRGRPLFDRAQVAHWAAARGLAAQAGFLAAAGPVSGTRWKLEPLLRAGGIWRDVSADELPERFVQIVTALPGVTAPVRGLLAQRLRAPGGVTMAPVGGGFALPHPASRIAMGRDAGCLALLRLREPVRLREPAPDDVPLTRLLFFVAPSPRAHLDLLGRLGRMLSRGPVRELMARETDDRTILQAVAASDAELADGAGGQGARA